MEAEQLSELSNSLQKLEQVVPSSFKDFLKNNKNILLILERNPETDKVRVGVKKIYSPEARNILKEARRNRIARKNAGYSREDAIRDFLEAQDEIANRIEKNES